MAGEATRSRPSRRSDMNGSGMPVIGMIPSVMPMFSKIWNANIASTPTARACRRSRTTAARCARGARRAARRARCTSRAADEAELLPHHGEDEVGVLLGHVRVLRQRAVEQARAAEAAGDDRGLRLLEVVLGLGLLATRARRSTGRRSSRGGRSCSRRACRSTTTAPTAVTPSSTSTTRAGPGCPATSEDRARAHADHRGRAEVVLHEHEPDRASPASTTATARRHASRSPRCWWQ